MQLLVLTEDADAHADHVIATLRARGADVVRFDPADFPTRAEISLAYAAGGMVGARLRTAEHGCVDLDRVAAVWWRRPGRPVAHAELVDPAAREYVEQECRTFAQDAWNLLDCAWLPARPPVVQRAQLKAYQLSVAGRLGFELPPTLVTNSPSDFLEFYRQHDGEVISKLAGSALFQSDLATSICRYTEVVSRRDLGYAQTVRYCPVIFQAYVPKRVELRVTVVGERVFAAEIGSQESNHTRHDWRRYDTYATTYQRHQLPHDLEQRCARLVAQLGLRYGAIDLILTPEGRYVFLELNPNGQYLWIERMTDLPISEAIADELLAAPPPVRLALTPTTREAA